MTRRNRWAALCVAMCLTTLMVPGSSLAAAPHEAETSVGPASTGCSHGYWKRHLGDWVGYSPSQTVASLFTVAGSSGSKTLLQALSFKGGSTLVAARQMLIRHAVAAVLNAAHPGILYPKTTAAVITNVNAALASDSRSTILTLADALDTMNNLGCEIVRGAPATYVFGPGVTAEQQSVVRLGIDIAARYFHGELGRDLPPVTVYVEDDLEGIVNLYAQTYPRSVELSRQIWQSATAVAAPRRIWVYTGAASWRPPDSNRAKIMVHEAFHVMQFELAGSNALDGEPDDIPRAGPRWLEEGAAEYIGYKAMAGAGLVQFSDARAGWISRTKLTTSPLRARETSRGLFGEPEPYQISPLAVDFLVGSRPASILVAYYEAIGRGVAWQEAFTTTFGKTVEAFYAEFETYRRGL